MEDETIEFFAAYLPLEIVLEIQEFLLIAYRISNAKQCAEIWSNAVSVKGNEKYVANGLIYGYKYTQTPPQPRGFRSHISHNSQQMMCTVIFDDNFIIRRDYRYRDQVPAENKILNILGTIFAPHKFRQYHPFWLYHSNNFTVLNGYNPIIKVAFRYYPKSHYNNKEIRKLSNEARKLNQFVRKECRGRGIRLIEIPFYASDFNTVWRLIRKVLGVESLDKSKESECAKIWRQK